jgi:staphylococcal nuclease domain-containing protein 1
MILTCIKKNTENRQFGTISVGKRADVGEVLVSEGLAVTQHHRDDEEKSPRYDLLVAAENKAKEAKKNIHSKKDYKKSTTNDLTDPKKAKAYSGSLMRAGKLKAVVEYVFNGSRFKVFVQSENCHIIFALENLKSPQPSAPSSVISRGQGM